MAPSLAAKLKEGIPQNEFLCTERRFTNFVLRVEIKLAGKSGNGGVQFRSKRIPNNNEVSGYQADMADPDLWGCLYDESRRNVMLARSKLEEMNRSV